MSGNDNYGYGYGYDYNNFQSTSPTQPLNNQYYNYGAQPQGNNFSQFQQPQQQAQHQQQQQHPSFNEFLNNPAAQIGVQFGAQALSAGQKYVNTNVSKF